MRSRFIAVALGTLGLGALLLCGTVGRSQDEPPPPDRRDAAADRDARNAPDQQEGVEVQARGPIHEAFAEPSIRGPRPSAVVPKKPPDAIEEEPPDQKPSGDAEWIPGYWAWDQDQKDFLWVSGIWRVPPPNRQWVPGHWDQADDGWQWVPGFWTSTEQKSEVEYLPEPPDPVAEAVPQASDDESSYVPGTWVYRDTRYMWRPGFWVAFRPGWLWVPAGYVWTPAGYIFVDGYWDRPFRDRGLLFAPVSIARRLLGREGWVYRPSYAVYDDFLMGAMFVRPDDFHYYFGDYFDPRYQDAGFTAWVDFRIGRRFYDPLLNYYRWNYRNDRRWYRDLDSLYVGRRRGDIDRPPRTLVEQTRLVNRSRGNNNLRNMTALGSLTQINRVVKLQRIPAAQLRDVRSHAAQLRKVSQERGAAETRLMRQGTGRERGAPRVAKFALPRAAASTRTQERGGPPPAPRVPQPQARQLRRTGTPPAGEDRAPPERRPSDRTSPDRRPSDRTPPERRPSDRSPPERRPSDRTPPERKPPDRSPPERRPPDRTPPERRPPDRTPPERKPSDRTPPDRKPAPPPRETKPRDSGPPAARPPATERRDTGRNNPPPRDAKPAPPPKPSDRGGQNDKPKDRKDR